MSLKDFLPKHHSELLLSFDEYVGTWSDLVQTVVSAIRSDEDVIPELARDNESDTCLSIEAALVLCFDAMRTWKSGRKVSEAFKNRLEEATVSLVGEQLAGGEASLEFVALYRAHEKLFLQFFSPEVPMEEERLLKELAMAARYIAFRCVKNENDEVLLPAIQRLAIHLSQAHEFFVRLSANSIPDGNTLLSKTPRFIVKEF